MESFKRRRRTRRDMVVLGGWLFADLLLGLAMLFLVANTVGSEPAEPTATAEPDYRATATVEFAEQQANSEQTIAVLEDDLALSDLNAQQTADASQDEQDEIEALATEEAIAAQTAAAQSDEERAAADASATESALSAQGTIDAISTEQAANESDSNQAAIAQATIEAEATELAISIYAQSTEQAELAAVATENAASGADSQGTVVAVETALAESQSAQATSEANASNAESTADALESSQVDIDSTIAALEDEARANTLSPQSISETFTVDVGGVLSGDQDTLDATIASLQGVLDKYVNGTNCRIGFINISTNHPDVGTGSQTSDRIGELIQEEFPSLLLEIEGQEPSLAYVPFANTGAEPTGEVELQLFTNVGCQPSG